MLNQDWREIPQNLGDFPIEIACARRYGTRYDLRDTFTFSL